MTYGTDVTTHWLNGLSRVWHHSASTKRAPEFKSLRREMSSGRTKLSSIQPELLEVAFNHSSANFSAQ